MWIYNPTAGEAETEGSGGPGWPGSLAEPVNSRFNHTHMRAHMHSQAQAHILLAVESLLISAHCHLRLPLLLVCRPASDIHPRLQSPPQATRCQVETLKFPMLCQGAEGSGVCNDVMGEHTANRVRVFSQINWASLILNKTFVNY